MPCFLTVFPEVGTHDREPELLQLAHDCPFVGHVGWREPLLGEQRQCIKEDVVRLGTLAHSAEWENEETKQQLLGDTMAAYPN